jgi:hypothetical protein
MISFNPADIPVDILPPIFAQLTDRRDLHAAALVSRTFNGAATPVSDQQAINSDSLNMFEVVVQNFR